MHEDLDRRKPLEREEMALEDYSDKEKNPPVSETARANFINRVKSRRHLVIVPDADAKV